MKFRPLANTGVEVSELCLGTMTFGQQNTEDEAHAQLNRAMEAGINFIDTAEIYPVPPKAGTQGRTEHHIGTWLRKRGRRDELIVATKVAAPADWLPYLRNGRLRLERTNIREALTASLERLGTEYVDLYQVHWPERPTNYFGQLGYAYPKEESDCASIEETLEALSSLVDEGLVRHLGVSNETPWGLSRYLEAADRLELQRIISIQNPYNLLNRSYEVGLAEFSHREQVGLLAYSPLAFGVLSGKYLDRKKPPGARLTLFDRFTRYSNPESENAVRAYVAIAEQYGLDPAQMALAFVTSRPFVTSNIIGATTLEQLDRNIASTELELSEELLEAIETVHVGQPNPAP